VVPGTEIAVLEAIETTYSNNISKLKLEKDSKRKSKVTGGIKELRRTWGYQYRKLTI
jgi:hypothetical protein